MIKKFLIILFFLLSLNLNSYADEYYECDHIYDETGYGNSANGAVHGMAGSDYRARTTGTVYSINVEGEVVNLILPAGSEIPGSDVIKGYNSMSKGEDSVPTGKVTMTQSDVEAALRAVGRSDLADSLSHEAQDNKYIMNVQQGIYMAAPGSSTYRWYSMEEINYMVANGDAKLAWDMWTPIKNGNEAWYDDNNQKGSATYSKENKTPTPPPPPPIPPPEPPPTEEIIDPKPIYDGYEFSTSYPSGSYSALGRIYDEEGFNVENCGVIPTSHKLNVEVKSNLTGEIQGFAENTYKFYESTYVYTASYEEYIPHYNVSGDYLYTETVTHYLSETVIIPETILKVREIMPNYKFTKVNAIKVYNKALPEGYAVLDVNINFSDSINNVENVVKNNVILDAGLCGSYEEALNHVNQALTANFETFWAVQNDHVYINEIEIFVGEGPVGIGSKYTLTKKENIIPEIENKSDGRNYTSTGIHIIEGIEKYDINKINSVRIHTPIHNELSIDITSDNQYIQDGKTNIVTLGDTFTARVNLIGESKWYGNIDTSSYVKNVEIHCGVCGKTEEKIHVCNVPITAIDNKTYKIIATVKAQNDTANGIVGAGNYNIPDEEYIITKEIEVFVVGKIYDLEVRTVDDPGWKLSMAQNLAKLPVGELKDNAVTSYKYGIKLGYRAYFDLKTLRKSK